MTNKAFTFIDIIIAITIISAGVVPIFYMLTSTRTETSTAINYLRAVELANEVMEWAYVADFGDSLLPDLADQLSILDPSIVELDSSGKLVPSKLNTAAPANNDWNSIVSQSLSHSSQYNNAFFFREVKIDNLDDFLKKMTVTVSWSEQQKPQSLNNVTGRTRQFKMSTLIINNRSLQL